VITCARIDIQNKFKCLLYGKGLFLYITDLFTRVYVKDFNGKNKIRIERQEYPKKTLTDAIEEKLGD
jgi:hypothetical protein